MSALVQDTTDEQQSIAHEAGNGRGPNTRWLGSPRLRRLWHDGWFWVRRYLAAELVGTGCLYLVSWLVLACGGGVVVVAYAATVGESAGFYTVLGGKIERELRRSEPEMGMRARLRRTLLLLIAECGPAEFLDVLLTRPLLLVLGMTLLSDGWDLLAGKIAADVVFYVIAGLCFTLTVKMGLRGAGPAEPEHV